ncbi:MAG TPA: hypothetical protein DCM45_04410 [Clostridiales bacterium]|nr:hypothetical protein [Clostridiales bacterium]
MKENQTHVEIGHILRLIREINGISQFMLADEPVANSTYLSSVERGCNKVSINKFDQICNGLGSTPDDILRINSCMRLSASREIDA